MYMYALYIHHPNSTNCILEKVTFTLCILNFKEKKRKHQSIDSKSERDVGLCKLKASVHQESSPQSGKAVFRMEGDYIQVRYRIRGWYAEHIKNHNPTTTEMTQSQENDLTDHFSKDEDLSH